jgi:hypothetical protein
MVESVGTHAGATTCGNNLSRLVRAHISSTCNPLLYTRETGYQSRLIMRIPSKMMHIQTHTIYKLTSLFRKTAPKSCNVLHSLMPAYKSNPDIPSSTPCTLVKKFTPFLQLNQPPQT